MSGNLRHQIIFQRAAHTQNAVGELVDGWTSIDSVKASVLHLPGRELYRDGIIEKNPIEILCRRGSELGNLSPNDRVLVPVGYTSTTSAITASGTSLKVTSASELPPAATPTGTAITYRIRVADEVLTVTAGHGTTTFTVARGADGSTATSHVSGSAVVYLDPLDIESVAPQGRMLEIMAVRNA